MKKASAETSSCTERGLGTLYTDVGFFRQRDVCLTRDGRELETKNAYNSFREVLSQMRAEVRPEMRSKGNNRVRLSFKTGNCFH